MANVASGAISIPNESTVKSITDNVVSQATAVSTTLQNKIKSAGLSGSDIIGSAANIGKTLFGNTSKVFNEVNAQGNTLLGNFSQDYANSLQNNFQQLPKALNAFTSGTQNLGSSGLSFIASTTSKAIDGIDLPGADTFTDFSSMGIGQLAKLSNMGSEALNSGSSALKSIVSTIQTGVTAGKTIASNVVSSFTTNLADSLAPLSSVTTTVASLLNPYTTANMVSNNLDFLPSPIRNTLSLGAANASASLASSVGSSIADVFGIDKIFGDALTSTLSNVLGTGSSMYPNRSDQFGNYLNGYSGYTGTDAQYQQLVQLVQEVCGKANITSTSSYGTNKTLYDMLLMACLQSGAGGLAAALLECASQYSDGRSNLLLGNMAARTAYNGDTYSTLVAYQYGGYGYVNDQRSLLTSLIGNSTYTNYNYDNINGVMGYSNYTMTDLLVDGTFSLLRNSLSRSKNTDPEEDEIVVYDATAITAMQATCTDYVDTVMERRDRNLVNAVYAAWH